MNSTNGMYSTIRRPHERARAVRRRLPRVAPLVVALTAGIVVAGGCSGAANGPAVANTGSPSGGSPSPAATGRAGALAYSRCMRAHGVPKFPDPGSDGEITLSAGPGSGIDPRSPGFKAADAACKSLRPGAGNRLPPKEARAAALKYARCMRAHGIADFPDPNPQGGIAISAKPGGGLDPNSPLFKAADRACRKYQPGGGKGGSLTSKNEGGGGA